MTEKSTETPVEFPFLLEDDGTGWPPAPVEWIYLRKSKEGLEVRTPPLFVKNISVGDIINVNQDAEGRVIEWSHIAKSGQSLVWIMVRGTNNIDHVLTRLRSLGCNTESFSSHNYFAVDVPAEVPFKRIDEVLATLDGETAAVAFPSFRHEEPGHK